MKKHLLNYPQNKLFTETKCFKYNFPRKGREILLLEIKKHKNIFFTWKIKCAMKREKTNLNSMLLNKFNIKKD